MRGHSLWPGLPHGGGGGVLLSQTPSLAGVEVTLRALGVSDPVRMVRAATGLDSHSLTLVAVSCVVPSESLGVRFKRRGPRPSSREGGMSECGDVF